MSNKRKGFPLLILSMTVLFYAIPKLPIHSVDSGANLFAVAWLCFALLVVAAHLYRFIGVDREEELAYRRIQRIKRWKMEQQLLKLSRRRVTQRS